MITADDAGFFQHVMAPRACGGRQAHRLGKLGIGHPAILLKRLQNGTIDGIQFRHS